MDFKRPSVTHFCAKYGKDFDFHKIMNEDGCITKLRSVKILELCASCVTLADLGFFCHMCPDMHTLVIRHKRIHMHMYGEAGAASRHWSGDDLPVLLDVSLLTQLTSLKMELNPGFARPGRGWTPSWKRWDA